MDAASILNSSIFHCCQCPPTSAKNFFWFSSGLLELKQKRKKVSLPPRMFQQRYKSSLLYLTLVLLLSTPYCHNQFLKQGVKASDLYFQTLYWQWIRDMRSASTSVYPSFSMSTFLDPSRKLLKGCFCS